MRPALYDVSGQVGYAGPHGQHGMNGSYSGQNGGPGQCRLMLKRAAL